MSETGETARAHRGRGKGGNSRAERAAGTKSLGMSLTLHKGLERGVQGTGAGMGRQGAGSASISLPPTYTCRAYP
eukprot:356327-Chlamydomonas_euryale.AAC.5